MNQTSPQQFDSNMIDQKAYVHAFQGRGQVVRDGFFLPVEVGMELQPGDRISAYEDSRAEITFTGVGTKLVLANGSSATLIVQITDPAQGPQWVASNLYGTKVFFEEGPTPVQLAATETVSMPTEESNPTPEAKPQVDLETPGSSSMMGLFGYDKGQSSFPVMETVAGVAGVALVAGGISTDDDDETTLTTASEAGFSDNTTNAGGGSGSGNGAGTGAGTGTSTGNTASGNADGSTGSGSTDGDGGETSSDNPLDALLAATPLGDALAPITSAASSAGLDQLTALLPTG